MNTAGANELAYASRAILSELIAELTASNTLSSGAAMNILDRAIVSINSLGNLVSVPGAVAVVNEIRADLAKRGVQ